MLFRRQPKAQLRSVVFELTPQCNLRCRHCYNTWRRPGEVHPEPARYRQNAKTLKRLFKQADLQQVTLSGGEPLLAERFLELVLLVRLKGKAVTLISNGTRGDQAIWKQLTELGVGLFELPVLGPDAALHERITQVPGSWARTMASIRQLKALDARVCAVVVISRLNLQALPSILERVASLGVDSVLLNRMNIGGSGFAHCNALWLKADEVDDLLVAADKASQRHGLRISSGVCTPLCIVDPARHPNLRTPTCSPEAARRPLTLDGRGDLRSCNHSPVVLGNIYERHIRDIIAGPELARWKDTIPDYCADCLRWDDCLGGCRAASEQLGAGLEAVDPLLWPEEELRRSLARCGIRSAQNRVFGIPVGGQRVS